MLHAFAATAALLLALQTDFGARTPPSEEQAERADGSLDEATPKPPTGGVYLRFGYCHTGGGTNCVVDGDTIWMRGQKIRLADIDAPETHDYKCAKEKELGDRATQRLHDLLNIGPLTLQSIDRDADRYGRKLRIVAVTGTSVGGILVSEGLARFYDGGARRSWC